VHDNDLTADVPSNLAELRRAWQSGPPTPDLSLHITDEIRSDPKRLFALVQCDALERQRVRGLPAWVDEDLPITIEHYEAIIGKIEPGSLLARMLIRVEVQNAANLDESHKEAIIKLLSERFANDVAVVVDDLNCGETTMNQHTPTDLDPHDHEDRRRGNSDDLARDWGFKPGQTIGRYELIDRLDRGSGNQFGEVWMARRINPFQRVAIKFMRHDRMRKDLLLRFTKVEPKALARFNHPYIARFYEIGTHQGTPYLVMEYVPGEQICKYCDERQLSVRERLELMAKLCDAVQHVHLQGVIHRDLKPANILATEVKPEEKLKPIPKLIDFGLAKSINPDSPLSSRLQSGFNTFAGTYEYASPEQVASRKAEDTSQPADIYALGAVLYELIVGVTPMQHVSRDPSLTEYEMQSRLATEPRPSLSAAFQCMNPNQRKEAAAKRGMTVGEMKRLLRGRISHLTDRALRLLPNDRFSESRVMAQDIENYLYDRNYIEAAAEPRWDKAIRRIKRHKLAYASTAAIALLLVSGIIGTSWGMHQAEQQRQVAEQARHDAVLAKDGEAEQRRVAEEQQRVAEHRAERIERNAYIANIQMAQAWLTLDDHARLRDRLNASRGPYRHWEWYWLDSQCYVVSQLKGHTGAVAPASFSPDGRRVATASNDETARVWDTITGETIAELRGHAGDVWSASFSPDGRRVVTASQDQTARVWDSTTGEVLAELKGHMSDVISIAFSPDGRRVVTGSADDTARIWDATTGGVFRVLDGHTNMVLDVSFDSDGDRVVTASYDGTARVWDATTGDVVRVLEGHTGAVKSALFSPDGWRVVTASSDGSARVWDSATGETIAELEGHERGLRYASFSPGGERVVTASYDGTARVWDAATGATLAELNGHSDRVIDASFSPDGGRVVTASHDSTARIWDAYTGEALAELEGHSGVVWMAEFSFDGRYVVTASEDTTARVWKANVVDPFTELGHSRPVRSRGIRAASFSPNWRRVVTANDETARVWDAPTGETIAELRGHAGQVSSASFSPDGRRVVTASSDKTARVWDAVTGETIAEMIGHAGQVWSASFSPDGRRVVTASQDETARVWDAATGEIIAELRGHAGQVSSASFSPDGRRVVTASSDKTARVWDAVTGETVVELRGHAGFVWPASFSPDGRRVVTASSDKTARVWDAVTGETVVELRGHAGQVWSASFSPDGRRVVTGSRDRTSRVWDVATGEILAELVGHEDYIWSASFSSDGRSLVTASLDGTARVWDAAPAHIREAEHAAYARGQDGSVIVRVWMEEVCFPAASSTTIQD